MLVSDVRQIEIHTAELLVQQAAAFIMKVSTVNKYNTDTIVC
jgi:hypothetical protein